jgi:hypothetical protein
MIARFLIASVAGLVALVVGFLVALAAFTFLSWAFACASRYHCGLAIGFVFLAFILAVMFGVLSGAVAFVLVFARRGLATRETSSA